MRRFYIPEPYQMAPFETLKEKARAEQLLYEKQIETYKEQIRKMPGGYNDEVMNLMDKIELLTQNIQDLNIYILQLDLYKCLLN